MQSNINLFKVPNHKLVQDFENIPFENTVRYKYSTLFYNCTLTIVKYESVELYTVYIDKRHKLFKYLIKKLHFKNMWRGWAFEDFISMFNVFRKGEFSLETINKLYNLNLKQL